jgi:4-hydroxybenzoyl-CoA thioesterase
MVYNRDIRIEFNHCDPAGIVFYPRYFEMTNSVAENFFREVGDYSYDAMMRDGAGVPTARLEATYHLPSRLGEVLDWRLTITKLGASSMGLHLEAHCGGTHRVTADLTLVFVNMQGRPQPWPDAIRARIAAFQEAT